ncbi:hypothetical protein N7462_010740 [Penicillium macrosclerotiorum]|uniref:uncharacterized protein n=1 Tax=Penicillium macrosclerotiorum TaxID=303699 RepID=UPI0025488F89|nr:uncharacterized protein N7462_010740 [Penicillium macrosclerotiorum]KAJ5669670.1 hypothetical protein N7462_010740 [Penicillium macrosclerotiorum]
MSDFSSAPLTSTQPYPETTQTDVFAPDLQGTQPFPFSNATSTQVAPELLVPASQTGLSYNEAIHSSQAQQSTEHTADISVEDQLSLYLASPTEERIAFLENWMCELIEDEQFMTLCQDVEGTWKRFAFGIKH